MRKKYIFLFLYSLISFQFSFAQSNTWVPREGLKTSKHVLKNGLEVWITENPKAPLVSIYHWVKVGSLHERKGITGISHLFEHMMFRPVREGQKGFFEELQPMGGSANANTRYMSTVYTTTSPAQHLEKVLKLEADRFKNLKVTDDLLNIERKAVWSEYSTKIDTNPVMDIWGKIYETAFPGHPYEWTIIGYREDLDKINAKDCNEFFAKFYRPNNTGLFISGNVNTKSVLAIVEKQYGDWQSGGAIPEIPEFSGRKQMRVSVGRVPSASQQILAGFYLNQEQKYLFEYRFLNHILFSSKHSLANKRLKQDYKIVSSISDFNFDYDSGLMKFFIIPLNASVKNISDQIIRLRGDFLNISDSDFQAYKDEYLTSFKEENYRNESFNENFSLFWGKMGSVEMFFQFEERLKAITRNSMDVLASNMIDTQNLILIQTKKK